MQCETKREYKASFQFVAGAEICPVSKQDVQMGDDEDFALMGLSIRPCETARVEDFRTLLYNCELEIVNERGKVEVQVPLMDLPSTPVPSPAEGMPLVHFWASETVELRILFDPVRPTAKRLSGPVEIAIVMAGIDKHKAKPKPTGKATARKKRATQ